MPDPINSELAVRMAELEGTVKTHQAETKAKVFEYQLENRTGWQAVLDKIADYRTEHQTAINTLSEKMVQRELRLVIALIMIIGLAFTIFRTTLPTPTIPLPTTTTQQVETEAITASGNPAKSSSTVPRTTAPTS